MAFVFFSKPLKNKVFYEKEGRSTAFTLWFTTLRQGTAMSNKDGRVYKSYEASAWPTIEAGGDELPVAV